MLSSDYAELHYMWNLLFRESENFLDLFFRAYPRPKGMVNINETGAITSVILWLPTHYCYAGEKYKCWYLYKYVTLPPYREQGIMSNMLLRTEQYASEQKIDGIIVVPTEADLWNYFVHRGYKLFARHKELTLYPSVQSMAAPELRLSSVSAHQISTLRKTLFSHGGILWDSRHIRLVLDALRYERREAYFVSFRNIVGYLVCNRTDGCLYVTEMALKIQHKGIYADIDPQVVTDALCSIFDVKKVVYTLCENVPIDTEVRDVALIKSNTIDYHKENYINLYLN